MARNTNKDANAQRDGWMEKTVDSLEKPKPKITLLPRGPLYFISNDSVEVVPCLEDSEGRPMSTVRGISLCRCGQSKNKPFCDGTHSAVGFTGENLDPCEVPDRRKDYFGKKITIHDNRRVCSHSAECIRNLESVFDVGMRPWINPDGADVDEISRVVKKCPSGALSYSINAVEHKDQLNSEPKVLVSRNGPYHVSGGIELIGVINWADGVSREHYTLCRCGVSNNKPFCDGNHLKIKFRDNAV